MCWGHRSPLLLTRLHSLLIYTSTYSGIKSYKNQAFRGHKGRQIENTKYILNSKSHLIYFGIHGYGLIIGLWTYLPDLCSPRECRKIFFLQFHCTSPNLIDFCVEKFNIFKLVSTDHRWEWQKLTVDSNRFWRFVL